MILKDVLPEIYDRLRLGKWLDFEIEEKSPTCDNCLMSRPERGKLPYYDSKLKCCTYHPFLPNYLLGAILDDKSTAPFVLDILNAKVENSSYLLPIGAFPPVRFQVLFNNRIKNDFGNRSDWICPYYDKNKSQCGIWKNRGATCSTYFCISDYGKAGLKFWGELFHMLNFLEIHLAEKALTQMGFTDEEVSCQFEYFNCTDGTDDEMNSDQLSKALVHHFWGGRKINILDFYRQCFKLVSDFTPDELRRNFESLAFKKVETKLNKAYGKLDFKGSVLNKCC